EAHLESLADLGPRPALPAALADLLRRCLRPEPGHRPADMLEIAAELEAIYCQATGGAYTRRSPVQLRTRAARLTNQPVALMDLGAAGRADALWEEALRTEPAHLEAVYNLHLHRWRMGLATEVALFAGLRAACAAQPGEWLPLYLTAHAFLEKGLCAAALQSLEQVPAAD